MNAADVCSVSFQYGAYLGESVSLEIKNEGSVVMMDVNFMPYGVHWPCQVEFSSDEWKQLLAALFDRIAVQNWKEDYQNNAVLDGIGWELRMQAVDGSELSRRGSNAFPENWGDLADLFEVSLANTGNSFSLHPDDE